MRAGIATVAIALALAPSAFAAAPHPALTIGWVGDIAFSTSKGLPPRGGAGVFSSVSRVLHGDDLTTGNLEGTLGHGGPSKCAGGRANCFAFQAPTSFARVLRDAGFGLMNMANNHSRDFGSSGLQQTQSALAGAGLAHTGLDHEITIERIRGVRVAFLGFAPYPWTSPLTDIPAARRLVAAATARARIVVVFIHAGAEGAGALHVPHGQETAFGENRGRARAFAHAVVDAGADAVLGSGPHVLRGMECYRRRLIAYSLGDFAGWNTLSTSGVLDLSGIVRVKLGPTGALAGGHLFPIRLQRPGVPRPDPSRAGIGLVQRLSREDFGPGACRIGARGDIGLP